MSNFQVYQTVLPTITVWPIRSAAEVKEAFEMMQRGEHVFHYRAHSYRDGESWPTTGGESLKHREGELYTEWWQSEYGNSSSHHEAVRLQVGNTIVLSSNGKAVILGGLPDVAQAQHLPAFIIAPELRPLG